jgi:hypothetical protein
MALSPASMPMSSMETPRLSATIWAMLVSVPCPWSVRLVTQRTVPEGSSRMVQPSCVEIGAPEGP